MAMPERICAYRAHAQHREIHNQRLIKSPPRPDYQQDLAKKQEVVIMNVQLSNDLSAGGDPPSVDAGLLNAPSRPNLAISSAIVQRLLSPVVSIVSSVRFLYQFWASASIFQATLFNEYVMRAGCLLLVP